MEPGDAELSGRPGQRVLDRAERTGGDRGLRQPHRDGARHRTRGGDADRHRVPGHRTAGRGLSSHPRGDAGRDLRGADAARAGHAHGRRAAMASWPATPRTRPRSRWSKARPSVEGPGVSLDLGANQTASDNRQRHIPGRGRAGAARRLPHGDARRRAPAAAAGASRRRPSWRRCRAATTWRSTAPGPTARNMARSGIRRWRRTGCRIARAAGPTSRRGAGPGWTAHPGGSLRSTTAAGSRPADAGAGSPAAGGVAPRPVYAPALVTFLGVGAVAGIGMGAALAGGRVGWLPLGPREPFRPWYRASDSYFRQVNVAHVTNFTTINRDVTINNFANRRAATVVPTSAMTASRPVGTAFQRVDPAQLAQARPVFGQQPLRPAPATVGRDAGGRPPVGLAAIVAEPAHHRAGSHVPCRAGRASRLASSRGRWRVVRPCRRCTIRRNPTCRLLPGLRVHSPQHQRCARRRRGRSGRRRYSGSRASPARVAVRRCLRWSIAVAVVRHRRS